MPEPSETNSGAAGSAEGGCSRDVAALRDQLADESHYKHNGDRVREIALELAKLGRTSEVVTDLSERLRAAREPSVRRIAALVLGKLGDPHAVDPLIERLRQDEDERVRAAAAVSLGDLGDDRAVDPLIEHLGNAPSPGELTLLFAWGREWRDQWETSEEREQSLRIRPRDSAAVALGRVGGSRAIPYLVDYFDRRETEICSTSETWPRRRSHRLASRHARHCLPGRPVATAVAGGTSMRSPESPTPERQFA